jgi:hypothetical protein
VRGTMPGMLPERAAPALRPGRRGAAGGHRDIRSRTRRGRTRGQHR